MRIFLILGIKFKKKCGRNRSGWRDAMENAALIGRAVISTRRENDKHESIKMGKLIIFRRKE